MSDNKQNIERTISHEVWEIFHKHPELKKIYAKIIQRGEYKGKLLIEVECKEIQDNKTT